MPSPAEILNGLTTISNEWRVVAVAWHVLLGVLTLTLAFGWRPTSRVMAACLISPLLSVSALAWWSRNPFNGAILGLLALILFALCRRLGPGRIEIGRRSYVIAGAVLIGFGWLYPHFLHTGSLVAYVYAAPLGLIPCPTLSAIVGMSLMMSPLRSSAWSAAVAAAGVFYGVIGVFYLGVAIDVVLIGGALMLAGTAYASRAS
jgi:hypothetical protein